MTQLNLLDLIYSDIFCEIQKVNSNCLIKSLIKKYILLQFLSLKDFFNLRCVNATLHHYIDHELEFIKQINYAGQDERAIDAFEVLKERCKHLQIFNISNCQWMTNELLIPILQNNSESLVNINLSYCGHITELSLHPIIIHCKKLKKLILSNCYWLTIGSFETLIFHHSDIEELDISGCSMISERCLSLLLQKFIKLRILSLASINSVNDNILFAISKYQTEIFHLNLFKCSEITDRGVGALSLNCKKLETISVRGCLKVTDRSLDLLRNRNIHVDVPKNAANAFINNFDYARRRLNVFYLQV